MRLWLRKWWPVIKALLAVAILVAIGRQFSRDLQRPELWKRSLRVEWLVLSGLLYLLGLGCSAFFWYRLLRMVGQQPAVPAVVRAYYLGHLGKYLPGKAWALFLRAGLVRSNQVRLGIATLTSLYEVLTTMAGGVLLAAILLPWQLPRSPPTTDLPVLRQLLALEAPEVSSPDRKGILLLIGLLMAVVGIPVIPAVFNRLVRRMTRTFPKAEAIQLPHLKVTALGQGLLLTACGWLLLGSSLWALLQAILSEPPAWSWTDWTRETGYLALAYVAGFVIIVVPSGLGVREFFLTLFLVPEVTPLLTPRDGDPKATVILIVLLLRLIWTGSEVIMASIIYWLPSSAVAAGPSPALDLGSVGTDQGTRTTEP
jgi:uncharacterized membrane protein YbhN (UPF0104 family)